MKKNSKKRKPSYEEFIAKAEDVVKKKKLDLSSDEDLSIGIMNLISIEEHLFFTAQKTGNDLYYELLREAREMRKELLKKIIKDYEGEVWCTSKHLLSASMRLMEVGTKQLGQGDVGEAKQFFTRSYNLYSLFWVVVLAGANNDEAANSAESVKKHENDVRNEEAATSAGVPLANEGTNSQKDGFFDSIRAFVKKAVDCCKE